MEEVIYYSELYDLYKTLLTEKQRVYFEDYYFKNLSLSEIAENYNISRNGVHNQLKLTKKALEEYEEKLHFKDKVSKLKDLFDDRLEEIDEIIFDN